MDEEYITNIDSEERGLKTRLISFLDSKYFVPIIIILVAVTAFVLGRLSKIESMREPVRVLNSVNSQLNTSPFDFAEASPDKPKPSPPSLLDQSASVHDSQSSEKVTVVGSKNSNKYHYPWCSGAKQISEKNLVTFDSIESAVSAGYSPAANCKGLE